MSREESVSECDGISVMINIPGLTVDYPPTCHRNENNQYLNSEVPAQMYVCDLKLLITLFWIVFLNFVMGLWDCQLV